MFLLQMGLVWMPAMRREVSPMSFLMCPFCVRAPLLALTTALRPGLSPTRHSWRVSEGKPVDDVQPGHPLHKSLSVHLQVLRLVGEYTARW
jgi:hypothetical protein